MIRKEDTPKHQGMRRRMIESLAAQGEYAPQVLEAMARIPRHYFLDPIFVQQAYSDMAFQIGAGQTISQPSTVAYQTTLLEVSRGHKVLEIGTGSGYQSCVLLELGAKVLTIERQEELYTKTSKFLRELGYNPKFYYGDGYKGLPSYGPFDRILVTCGAPFIPPALLSQLAPGGILVVPVGEGRTQRMHRIIRNAEPSVAQQRRQWFIQMTSNARLNALDGIEFTQEELKACSFVPMLVDKA